ncbi:rhodopsin, GQ-coupled [Biomphalaria glabrata]|nr:rhodopsin, GQ-coupled [Biomphalaria glabrata]
MYAEPAMNSTAHSALTHVHWTGQESPAAAVHFAVGVFITIVAMASVCGNALVVFICIRYKDLRTRSNILIINLAVGDLLMCSIDFPLLAAASFHNHWSFGWKVCQIYAFLTAVAGLVTINTLAVIAADRYWAVVRRPNPGQHLPKCVTATAVLFVWAYSISWALCPVLGWGAYVLDGIGTTCTFDYLTRTWENRSFVLGMVAGNFLLPLSVMVFSYARIWMAVREVKSGLERESSHVSMGQRRFSMDSIVSLASDKRVKDRKTSTASVSLGSSDSNYVDCSNAHRDHNVNRVVFHSRQRWTNRDTSSTDMQRGVYKQNSHTVVGAVLLSEAQSPYSLKARADLRVGEYRTYSATFRTSGDKKQLAATNLNLSFIRHATDVYTEGRLAEMNERNFGNGDGKLTQSYASKHRMTVKSMFSNRLENAAFSKIRLRYYNAIGSKLLLKHHRYRLHCEHKTIKIIMFLLLAFMLSWSPYMIVSLIGLFGDQTQISYVTSAIPSLIAKTSMVFNPLLYSISHPKVRKRIIKSLCSASPLHKTRPFHFRSQRFLSSLTTNSHSC